MDKIKLSASLFPISGIESIKFDFRFLRVREPIPDDNQRPIRLQQWADRLWRSKLRCPVYPTYVDGIPGFLIPNDEVDRIPSEIELIGVPDQLYHIEISDEIQTVDLKNAKGIERDLVSRMLERPITTKLLSLRNIFWRAEWTLFYPLAPDNQDNPMDLVDAYRGFKFGVVLIEGYKPYIAVDIRTRYVSRRSLADYSVMDHDTTLDGHLDPYVRTERRSTFLRDNGYVKIPCRYSGETGQTISQFEFEPGQSVYNYYCEKYPQVLVDPQDQAVFVKDRQGQGPSLASPSCRLFPVFTTESDIVRKCSVRPWLTPDARNQAAVWFLENIKSVYYNDKRLSIKNELFTSKRTVFIPPSLEFGNDYRLDFSSTAQEETNNQLDRKIAQWSSRKYPALLEAGPQFNERLPDIVFLYPDSVQRSEREAVIVDITKEMALQTGQKLNVIQQKVYSSGNAEKMGGSLLRAATEIKSLPGRNLALVVLSNKFIDRVHGDLKERIQPLLSQCVTERTIQDIVSRRNPKRSRSQIRNLTLAIITEAGIKPWVLADELHHDLHVGIDLLHGRVGYHLLYGTGGRFIDQYLGESREKGRAKEAIKRPIIQAQLYESISGIVRNGHRVRHIVIHRDGRWWPSESAGLKRAIEKMQKEGILSEDLIWAVMEVRKNHLPVRLFTKQQDGLLRNPLPGTYLILDESRALLSTTGRPGWDTTGKTASTVLFNVVESSADVSLEWLLEDAYRLTHLNWSAPDIDIALPVTIRWTDEVLRETLQPSSSEEDEEYEDEDDDTDTIDQED
ncbi:Piwi domain-containing protein [Chloroflexota bacterium]